MKAYLDTCIVSGLAKSDLSSIEQEALKKILDLHEAESVELCTSAEVEEELSEIPDEHREPHLQVFRRFLDLPRAKTGALTSLGSLGPMGNPRTRRLNGLKEAGLDDTDAMHVFIAASNRMKYFVTTDKKTILRHADQIQAVSGVHAILPSDFLNLLDGKE